MSFYSHVTQKLVKFSEQVGRLYLDIRNNGLDSDVKSDFRSTVLEFISHDRNRLVDLRFVDRTLTCLGTIEATCLLRSNVCILFFVR